MKNKIIRASLFMVIICFTNMAKVFAADSIGIKVQIKDAMGAEVQSAYVLKNDNQYFATKYGDYKVLASLPLFTTDNGAVVINDYINNDTNISTLLKTIGSRFSLAEIKSNNYVISVSGIYGGTATTEYNYYVKTCKTEKKANENGLGCTLCCTKKIKRSDGSTACQLYQYAKGKCMGIDTKEFCEHEYKMPLNSFSIKWFPYMEDVQICNSAYSGWTTSDESKFAKNLNSNQSIVSDKTKSRYIDNYQIVYASTATFDRTNIEQAELCGEKSTYKDTISIEEAIGTSYFLDEKLGSRDYCPVYCVEENTFTWPGFKPTAQMGGHFTWTIGKTNKQNITDGLTVKLNGKRECRTKIDLKKWKDDYETLQEKISQEEATLKIATGETCITIPGPSEDGCGWFYLGDVIDGEKSGDYKKERVKFPMSIEHARKDFYKTSAFLAQIQEGEYYRSEQGVEYSDYFKTQYSGVDIRLDGDVTTISYEARRYVVDCPCKIVNELESAEVGGEVYSLQTYVNTGAAMTEVFFDGLRRRCNAGYIENSEWGEISAIETKHHAYRTSMTCNIKSEDKHTYEPTNDAACSADTTHCRRGPTGCECISSTTTYQYIEVTGFLQEQCRGTRKKIRTGPIPGPCTKTCKTGYRFGVDEQGTLSCYKIDTSYLQELLSEQQAMLDILAECSNLATESYVLDTEMTTVFEEPKYGRNVDLNKKTTDSSETVNHSIMAIDDPSLDSSTKYYLKNGKTVKIKRCSLDVLNDVLNPYCWEEEQDVSAHWISEFGKLFEVEYEYTLPTNFYRYVLIPSGVSADSAQSSTNKFGEYKNYIDVGFPNYPVDYSTPKGTYDLDVIYKNVGFNDHFTQYITTGIDKSTNIITYDCEYDVKDDELVRCDDPSCGGPTDPGESDLGGIRIIYRPISLVDPFPSIDGDTRVTGNNWCYGTDCSWNNPTVSKYILNNRGVLYDENDYDGENIYSKKEPMYETVLNPSIIKEIRHYNETTTYDDYNLYCSDGYDCQSTFIKDTFQGLFTGCGASDDFDLCDSQDNYAR